MNFCLENIYVLLANPNQRPYSAAKLPAFSPATSAFWLNVLVPELSHQPFVCNVLATAMGTSIRQDHSTGAMQSAQAGEDSCILRERRRQIPCSV